MGSEAPTLQKRCPPLAKRDDIGRGNREKILVDPNPFGSNATIRIEGPTWNGSVLVSDV